ncbi:MAG: SAM-dependent methyltransferase [Polyangiaceae bacterium]
MSIPSKIEDSLRFLKVSLQEFDQSASLLPSSRWMVEGMASAGPVDEARTVVELGSGMGTITEGILRRMRSDAKLFAIEIDPALVEASSARLQDPRLKFIQGSAEHASELVREAGGEAPVDVAVSSVGLSMMPEDLRRRIVKAAADVIKPTGTLVHCGYLHAKWIVYSPTQGIYRYDAEGLLREFFYDVRTSIVWLNLLPIKVYVCRAKREINA